MNNEIKVQRIKIANKNDVLIIDLSVDLNAKILYFIENANLPVCLMNGNFQFDTVYDLLGQEVDKKYQEVQSKESLIEI